VGTFEGKVQLWDLKRERLVSTFEGHTDNVNAIVLTPDRMRAVSVSEDRTLKVWDISSALSIACFTADAPLASCALAANGRTIVAGDGLGNLHFLELARESPVSPKAAQK
jgi:WD40 repeat protein